MNITILSVGKRSTPYDEMIAEYTKRVTRPFSLLHTTLPGSSVTNSATAIREESKMLLEKIPDRAYVIVCDERGKSLASPQLAELLDRQLSNSVRDMVFIIGGSYGLDQSVRDRADTTLSLSSMVFPHEIVRLVITEQIYRAITIIDGKQYHH
jgi:23S rRNA (pseudouridine1915-N3)-methyltransferase